VIRFPHDPWEVLGVLAIAALLLALHLAFERREYLRKAGLVRVSLASERCPQCDGPVSDWDGRFERGDVHFNPGSYSPRISVACARCHRPKVFYVRWDGRLFPRHKIYFFEPSVGDGCRDITDPSA
jgi:hypothetical protein